MRIQNPKQVNMKGGNIMAWDVTDTNQKVIVKLVKDGQTTTREFDESTTVKTAAKEIARENGLKHFVLTEADGTEIDEADGSETLGNFAGPITMTPQLVGAQ